MIGFAVFCGQVIYQPKVDLAMAFIICSAQGLRQAQAGFPYAFLMPLPEIPNRSLMPGKATMRPGTEAQSYGLTATAAPFPFAKVQHARSSLRRAQPRFFRGAGRLCARSQPSLREDAMFEPILGLVATLGLGVYLVVTLLFPEKF